MTDVQRSWPYKLADMVWIWVLSFVIGSSGKHSLEKSGCFWDLPLNQIWYQKEDNLQHEDNHKITLLCIIYYVIQTLDPSFSQNWYIFHEYAPPLEIFYQLWLTISSLVAWNIFICYYCLSSYPRDPALVAILCRLAGRASSSSYHQDWYRVQDKHRDRQKTPPPGAII